jgi:DNA invertase Pin-like site-specific DNA recombinase
MIATPRHVRLYERISRDREGRELGVELQHNGLISVIEKDPTLVIVDSYRDNDIGASKHSKKKRPQYDRLLRDARSDPGSIIYAYTSARLTRRPREHEDQIELAETAAIEYRFIRSPSFNLNTADGRAVARTLAAWDAAEAERDAERVIDSKVGKRKTGEFMGGQRAFGYERHGMRIREREARWIRDGAEHLLSGRSLRSLVAKWDEHCPPCTWSRPMLAELVAKTPSNERPDEAALIYEAVERMYAPPPSGRDIQSPREVVWEFADRGIPIIRGHWHRLSVRNIMLNPRNAGIVLVNDGSDRVLTTAQWPAIISEDTWRALRAKLNDPERITARAGNNPQLGNGVYRCGNCGALMMTGKSMAPKGAYRTYRCRAGAHMSIATHIADRVVNEAVRRILREQGAKLVQSHPEVDVAGLRRRATELRVLIDECADAYAKELIALREMLRAIEPLKVKLAAVDYELGTVASTSPLLGVADAADPVAAYDTITDIEYRRAIVQSLMTVTIIPSRDVQRPAGMTRLKGFDLRVQLTPPGALPVVTSQ